MTASKEEGGAREDAPSSSPSSRVQLEVAFLDADRANAEPVREPLDERMRLTVLVIAAEADLRRYVRECLRDRTDLRVVEVATVGGAVTLAADLAPTLLVVDEPEHEVLAALADVRTILIVDDVPRGDATARARLRLLARPFTAEGLLADVDRLLASS